MSLAAQTLSRSIADALEFLEKDLYLSEFQGSESTVRFIRTIDSLFDILNSRNPNAEGFKAPLRLSNEENWRPFLLETVNYLLYLTDVGNIPLWTTPKKIPIFGFVITALSVCGIFDKFVKTNKLSYFLTYKCSQDHLEMLFSMIR